MSLKKEITLILLLVIGLFTALDYSVQRFIVFPSYRELDHGRARTDLQRGTAALEREILHLDKLVHDWSVWDDSLAFVRGGNPAFIDSNLGPNTFLDNRLNAIVLLDPQGLVVWSRICTLDDLAPLALEELPADRFPADSPLINHRIKDDHVSGVLLTGAGPMLIAARPVVDSEKIDLPAGTLLMGRLLGLEDLQAIEAQTGAELSFWSCRDCDATGTGFTLACSDSDCRWQGATPATEDLAAIRSIDRNTAIALREEGDGHISAYNLVPDVAGAGFLVLRSRSAMPISVVGRDVLRGAMLSILCVGLLILAVLLEALKFSVLKPISLLTCHAVALRRGERQEENISNILHSGNEIGLLAREFDSMVAQLAMARRQLAEQSYYSGMTEMASGVIHNLRNALTPVTANLDLLKEDFRDLPLSQMKRAGVELAESGEDEERRKMLARYLRESLQYLDEVMAEVQARLKNLDGGLLQVETILSNQEKFAARNRKAELIYLARLLREISTLLNLDHYSGLELIIDSSVEAAGTVEGQRNALMHIFTNLISNATEAIFRTDRRDGRIEIRAVLENDGESEQVHVMISDNGCGISADDLPHVFSRGYTTKENSGSGIGLHWLANTVAGMHGRLWAESEGPGQGAVLHVLLPKRLQNRKGSGR